MAKKTVRFEGGEDKPGGSQGQGGLPAAGWYPDSRMAGTQRYWDGEKWTEQTAPLSPGAAPTSTSSSAKPSSGVKKFFMIVGAIVTLIFLASVCVGYFGDSEKTKTQPPTSSDKIQHVGIPGEATISLAEGQSIRVVIKGVSMRSESLPGNEFTKAPEGKTFMVFDAEIKNVGTKDHDLSSDFRLKLPSGEILNSNTSLTPDSEIRSGSTLTPGASKAGTITFEAPIPQSGQKFVLLWKPSPLDADQAQFTYTHP